MNEVIIGTAGHIDHGKTTLVKVLTGVDTDTLKEEKKRGITIETGVAHWDHFIPNVKITFMDVPGHEKFIRNMVAGVQSVDLFLLVVAADDGIMPQTREHLDILSLLNIRKGIVAITKADNQDAEWLQLIRDDISSLLKNNGFSKIPICVTDSLSGLGIENFKSTLRQIIGKVSHRETWRKFFYMPVDKYFQVAGFGTVFRGTIEGGTSRIKDTVQLYPASLTGRIRGIHSHNRSVESASVGTRVGINVPNIPLSSVPVNPILAAPDSLITARYWLAKVQVLPGTSRPIQHMDQVHVLHTTRNLVASVRLLEKKEIPGGSESLAILDFGLSLPFHVFDRPVLRQFSPLITIGGAVILKPFSKILSTKSIRSHLEDFHQIARAGSLKQQLLAVIQSYSPYPITLPYLERLFNRDLKQVIEELMHESQIEVRDQVVIPQSVLQQVSHQLETLTRNYFSRYQDHLQVSVRQLDPWGFTENEWDMMLQFLNGKFSFKLQNGVIFREGLSDELLELQHQLLQWLDKQGNSLIEWKFILQQFPEHRTRIPALLSNLEREGKVIKANPMHWMTSAYAQYIRTTLACHFETHSELTVADLKKALGLTRKNAIPILEFTDQEGWTERRGNIRLKGEKLID